MIQCPWCGTSYTTFQSNCSNCGGPLAMPAAQPPSAEADIQWPPPPPRPISDRYVWRLLGADGWAVVALILILIGGIFTLLGAVLTLVIITAFIGIPFLGIGVLLLAGGLAVGYWRYTKQQKVVQVLRSGEAVRGRLEELHQNLAVRVNGRSPWIIRYAFEAGGQPVEGEVTTLVPPGPALQAGQEVCVLYLPGAPQVNSLYPHP